MPYSFNVEGICVLCGEEAWVGFTASKCKECVRKLGNKRNREYYKDPIKRAKNVKRMKERLKDPVIRTKRNKRMREYMRERLKDPVKRAKHNKYAVARYQKNKKNKELNHG